MVAVVLSTYETTMVTHRSKVAGGKGGRNGGCYLMKEEAKMNICLESCERMVW